MRCSCTKVDFCVIMSFCLFSKWFIVIIICYIMYMICRGERVCGGDPVLRLWAFDESTDKHWWITGIYRHLDFTLNQEHDMYLYTTCIVQVHTCTKVLYFQFRLWLQLAEDTYTALNTFSWPCSGVVVLPSVTEDRVEDPPDVKRRKSSSQSLVQQSSNGTILGEWVTVCECVCVCVSVCLSVCLSLCVCMCVCSKNTWSFLQVWWCVHLLVYTKCHCSYLWSQQPSHRFTV